MSEKEKQILLASGQLISISDASKLTPYSSEYLSLLARKGRLPALKISRDWLTTRQAVLAYSKQQEIKHRKFLKKFEGLGGGYAS